MNQRIRELRKTLGLTQTEFGKRLGIKQTTVAGYETGGRTPIDAVVSLICRQFQVNEQWLRTGEGEMFASRTREEEISCFVEGVLAEESDSFKKRFIELLAKLEESDWQVLERMANQLAELDRPDSKETSK